MKGAVMGTRANSPAFRPGRIGNLEVKNRLVRSATFENAASEKGEVTDYLVDFYRTLAEGGVGLIITGITPAYSRVHAPRQMRIDDDSCVPGLRRIADAVHGLKNDCKIMLQLHHPGRQIPDPDRMAEFARFLPPALLAAMQQA
jgi:2,4-dienoyl-CoA reductase-like NADH-dependent reductase (Old Yellow Enzyme family)